MILVSGCLLGICCRYDGLSKPDADVMALVHRRNILPVCPEQLGGLPTPRKAAYIAGGDGFEVLSGTARVLTVENKKDVTDAFIRGARECERLARLFRIKKAILKSRSPSCGLTMQTGVTAAALILAGLEVLEAG